MPRYTEEQKTIFLDLAQEVGVPSAVDELGYPDPNTGRGWAKAAGVELPDMRKEPDPVWDTLVELYGELANSNEHGRREKAVQQLKQANATPEEIHIRFERYSELMGSNIPNTDTALANNWTRLGAVKPRSKVASIFRAIWPNGKFEEEGWSTLLKGFDESEIIAALEQLGFTHQFPPGAIDVKKAIIHTRLGKAPPSPKAALSLAQSYREAVSSSYTTNGIILPSIIHDALEQTKERTKFFDDQVFLEVYEELLANFYQSYQK